MKTPPWSRARSPSYCIYQRNNYNTVLKSRNWDGLAEGEDWRQVFLDEQHGRIISWKGTFYMKANATELRGFLIRNDKLDVLARATSDRCRGGR